MRRKLLKKYDRRFTLAEYFDYFLFSIFYLLSSFYFLSSFLNLCLPATPFGQALSALELNCDDLRLLWSRSNLHASQSKFFIVWPPNPSYRKLITFYYPMKYRIFSSRNVCLRLVFTCGQTLQLYIVRLSSMGRNKQNVI